MGGAAFPDSRAAVAPVSHPRAPVLRVSWRAGLAPVFQARPVGRGEAGLPSVELVCGSPTVGVGERGGGAGRGRRSLRGGGVGGS